MKSDIIYEYIILIYCNIVASHIIMYYDINIMLMVK